MRRGYDLPTLRTVVTPHVPAATATLALALCSAVPALPATEGELEHVTVRAKNARGHWDQGDDLLARALVPEDAPTPLTSIADLARQQPSIAYSGQGGLLQTLSVRGLSGQQVANFWGDLPILSERRAGTASAFIDPVMLGTLEILRGPASTYYGNGAGAGVLQLSPRRPAGPELTLQWSSAGDENLQYLASGNADWSLAISRRSADEGATPSGSRLHSRYDQYNLQAVGDFAIGKRQFSLQQLFSEGRDIGKSNTQFPDRVTDYPRERHWLGQLSGELPGVIESSLYYHYQQLETRVEQPADRVNEVSGEALDWGVRLVGKAFEAPAGIRFGAEYFGRRDVTSDETETDLPTGERASRQNLDAEQDTVDLFADSVHHFGAVELGAGLRWSWIQQSNRASDRIDDSAWSGFARLGWHPEEHWMISLEFARGQRFAGVSERFFIGTTGRGQVLGNPSLRPEDTLGMDFGLQWQGERTAVTAHVFRLKIDDYIERVPVSDDLRAFRNLTKGDIGGAELALTRRVSEAWSLEIGGHYVDAEDNAGTPLADAVAPSAFAALQGEFGRWRTRVRYEHRFSENRVAPGELPLDSARQLQVSVLGRWGSGMELSLWGRNLLDETYRLSSDSLATDAPERSVGLTLSWRQRP